MELEDLKQAWGDYDKKLNDNLKTNKELLKRMILDRANLAVRVPKNYEYFSLVINFLFLLYVVRATIDYVTDIKILVSGILSSVWLVVAVVLTFGKLKVLTNIDFYAQSILEIQKQFILIQKKYMSYKRFELFSFPLIVIVLIPVVGMAAYGFNFFQSPVRYAIGAVLAMGLGYPIAFWIYKNWYDKKLLDANKFLEELSIFESE